MMPVPSAKLKAGVRYDVHEAVCKFLGWSMQCCAAGTFPATGFYGETFKAGSVRAQMVRRRLAGTWRAVLVGIKCDGKMKVQTHHFQRYWRCGHICESCMATQPYKGMEPALGFGNLTKTAPWRLTRITHRVYLNTEPIISSWRHVRGYHLQMTWRDLLHVLFLGVGQDFCASILWDLVVRAELDHPVADVALKILFIAMKAWCKARALSAPTKLFSLCAIGKPIGKSRFLFPLLSSEYKASQVKAP
jgi:hypothetical protein